MGNGETVKNTAIENIMENGGNAGDLHFLHLQ